MVTARAASGPPLRAVSRSRANELHSLFDGLRRGDGIGDEFKSCRDLLRRCEKSSQWALSLDVLAYAWRRMRSRGQRAMLMCLSSTAGACGRGSRWDHAVRLLSDARSRNICPDLVLYNVVLNACDRGQQWRAATTLFDDMSVNALLPDVVTFSTIMSACSKAHRWDLSLHLLHCCMPSYTVEPNVFAYNTAISACERGRLWKHALFLVRQMPKSSVKLDTFSFNSAISACEKGQQWLEGLNLFESMRRRHHVAPNIISYNATISACGAGVQWAAALNLLSSAKLEQLRLDVISYSAGISACAEAHHWAWSAWLLHDMQQNTLGVDPISMSAAIHACERGQQWALGVHLVNDLLEADFASTCIPINAAISACEKGHAWQHALELFNTARCAGINASTVTLNTTIRACGRGRLWDLALSLLASMPSLTVLSDANTYTAVLEATRDEVGVADCLMKDMRSKAVEPDVVSYRAAVNSMLCHGDYLGALATYREAVEGEHVMPWHIRERGVMDLHDFPAEIAKLAVVSTLMDVFCGLLTPGKDLIIVVGVGNHSRGGQLVLGPAIVEMLQCDLGIHAEPVQGNAGRILIPDQELRSYMDAGRTAVARLSSEAVRK